MISPQTTVVPARYSKTMWFDFRWVVTKVTFLIEELLAITPIKAIEHAVSQNGHDSSELHRIDPEATMRRILAKRGL